MLFAIMLIFGVAFSCVALPLLTYSTSLAAFGLPHVVAEMRYVYIRFGSRWPKRLVLSTAGLLGCIVCIRIGNILTLWSPAQGRPIELGLVTILAALTIPVLWRKHAVNGVIGGLLVLAVGLGAIYAPILTALFLAIAHNFTPVGFFAEGLKGVAKRNALIGSVIILIGIPIVIATGIPFEMMSHLGLVSPEASLLPTKGLGANIGVYVPAGLQTEPIALHLFSAVVFAQCMHYAAVIHVLPRMGETPIGVGRWAGTALFVIGAITLLLFSQDFFLSRKTYGVAAAIHAWIEVPILLAALLGAPHEALKSTSVPV